MCAGCGTPAAGALLAAGEDGLALAGGAPEPARAPCAGAAQPATPKASSALDAATRGNALMGQVWPAGASRAAARPARPGRLLAWRLAGVQDEEQEAQEAPPVRDVVGEQLAGGIGRDRWLADDRYPEAGRSGDRRR